MTEEMAEDKTKEGLDEENLLGTEVADAIDKVVQAKLCRPGELGLFAEDLARAAARIARWAGYIEGVNEAKQLAKDVITEAKQDRGLRNE